MFRIFCLAGGKERCGAGWAYRPAQGVRLRGEKVRLSSAFADVDVPTNRNYPPSFSEKAVAGRVRRPADLRGKRRLPHEDRLLRVLARASARRRHRPPRSASETWQRDRLY